MANILILFDGRARSHFSLCQFFNYYNLSQHNLTMFELIKRNPNEAEIAGKEWDMVLHFTKSEPIKDVQYLSSDVHAFLLWPDQHQFKPAISSNGRLMDLNTDLVPDEKAIPDKVLKKIIWLPHAPYLSWGALKKSFNGDCFTIVTNLSSSTEIEYLVENCPQIFDPESMLRFWVQEYGQVFLSPNAFPGVLLPQRVIRLEEQQRPDDPMALMLFSVHEYGNINFNWLTREHLNIGYSDAAFDTPFNGFDSIASELFSLGEKIDFIGIGQFFFLISTSENFRSEIVHGLYDNDPDKKGLELFSKTVNSISDSDPDLVSEYICLTVQWPEGLLRMIRDWLNGRSREIFILKNVKNTYRVEKAS